MKESSKSRSTKGGPSDTGPCNPHGGRLNLKRTKAKGVKGICVFRVGRGGGEGPRGELSWNLKIPLGNVLVKEGYS